MDSPNVVSRKRKRPSEQHLSEKEPKLVASVLAKHWGILHLPTLKNLCSFSDWKNKSIYLFRKFLITHDTYFQITKVERLIYVVSAFNVRVCETILNKDSCSNTNCSSLHLCPYFLCDACPLEETTCHFGHIKDNEKNSLFWKANDLNELDNDQLFWHLCRNDPSLLPRICFTYNQKKYCYKDQNCHYLHMCSKFLKGKCRESKKCDLNHDFQDFQVQRLLKNHALAVQGFDETSLSSQFILSDSLDEKFHWDNMKNDIYICVKFLRGKCNNRDCADEHSFWPYVWLYCLKPYETFKRFDLSTCRKLEKVYSDPNYDKFTIKVNINNNDISLNINMSTLLVINDCQISCVQRISTRSLAQCKDSLATEWLWYWKPHNNWIKFDGRLKKGLNSCALEKAYFIYKHSFTHSSYYRYRINFRDSIIQNLNSNLSAKIISRPAYRKDTSIVSMLSAEIRNRLGLYDERSFNSKTIDYGHNLISTPDTQMETLLIQKILPKRIPNFNYIEVKTEYSVYELLENDEVLMAIKEEILNDLPNARLHRIFKIVNEDKELEKKFNRKKIFIQNNIPAGMNVYQGNLYASLEISEINLALKSGFSYPLGIRGEFPFGKGNYFFFRLKTVKPSLSLNTIGSYVALRCQVLFGNYTLAQSFHTAPPENYHSCVDNVLNPQVVIIYHADQIYPNLLIEFEDWNPKSDIDYIC